jgi:hypothetical protein
MDLVQETGHLRRRRTDMHAGRMKMKPGKLLKRMILGFFGLVAVALVLLILNNRIVAGRYSSAVTDSPDLTSEEVSAVQDVYAFLAEDGESVLPGFHGEDIDLIIYNAAYEFLFTPKEAEPGWELLGNSVLPGRKLFRRPADNPQAFAVYVGDRWVGSMSTLAHFNRSMTEAVGPIFPPQFILLDEAHYKGVVVHEMVHALQGKEDDGRLRPLSTLHDISASYEDDEAFNDLIAEEAASLDQAIRAGSEEEVLQHARSFLATRQERRTASGMDAREIQEEKDFEWLEGLARYAEFKASEGSRSLVRSRMDRIEEKVRTRGDDRYYTLGMAQAMVLDRLDRTWKDEVFLPEFTLEERLGQLVRP